MFVHTTNERLRIALLVFLLFPACERHRTGKPLKHVVDIHPATDTRTPVPKQKQVMNSPRLSDEPAHFVAQRETMVRQDLSRRDIIDPLVLRSMGTVPRQAFVPEHLHAYAYADRPLPIGYQQTISQPYIVAIMTQLVQPSPAKKALDIGTGSGYQTAVLAELVDHVYGIEIVCPLADTAKQRLEQLNYSNVTVKCGDGYVGWPEHAPFDIIIVAAAPEQIPKPLIDQLAPGGRLVIPVGKGIQQLRIVEKTEDGWTQTRNWGGVRFVPMTGKAQQ